MRSSRLMSLIEAVANVVVGYGIAVLTQMAVFPLFGLNATIGQNLAIGAIFTVVSLIRSFATQSIRSDARRMAQSLQGGLIWKIRTLIARPWVAWRRLLPSLAPLRMPSF